MQSTEGAPGTSRLQRLIILLDTGSTNNIRQSAAKQIGEIAKCHPNEIFPLIKQVKKFLKSRIWETRVAAAQALGSIIDNVHHPSLDDNFLAIKSAIKYAQWPVNVEEELEKSRKQIDIKNLDTHFLTFERFDISQILEKGATLLSSAGEEYNVALDDSQKSTMEQIAAQRKLLEEKLGLNGCEQFIDMDEVIRDEDFIADNDATTSSSNGKSHKGSKTSVAKDNPQKLVDSMVAPNFDSPALFRSLSARERNVLKRKARSQPSLNHSWKDSIQDQESKKAKESTEDVGEKDVPNPSEAAGLDLEAVGSEEEASREWPLEELCGELLNELFDPVWEIRHGAAMALRELLGSHAVKAHVRALPEQFNSTVPGTLIPREEILEAISETEKSQRDNAGFIADVAIRLITVMALDRFGDYVSDRVVAPVRETCAQALGALGRHMQPTLFKQALSVLARMQACREWEVRHGSILAVKYLVAVRTGLVPSLLAENILPICLSGLSDADEDVCATSAEALLPSVVPTSLATLPACRAELPRLVVLLWDALLPKEGEDSSRAASTASAMKLLCQLYAQPEAWDVLSDKPSVESLNDEDILGVDADIPPLDELAPRLWPLTRHTLDSVRLAATETMEHLVDYSQRNKEEDGGGWLSLLLESALRLTLQNFLIEKEDAVRRANEKLWTALLKAGSMSGQSRLKSVSSRHLAAWLKLAATPGGAALDPNLLFSPGQENPTPKKKKQKGSKQEPSLSHSEPCMGPTDARLAALNAFGQLAALWPLNSLQELCRPLMAGLRAISALDRQVAAMASSFWFRHVQDVAPLTTSSHVASLHSLAELLLQCGDPREPTPGSPSGYAELEKVRGKISGEVRAMLAHAKAANIKVQLTEAQRSHDDWDAESAALLADSLAGLVTNEGAPAALQAMEKCRLQVAVTSAYFKGLQTNLHTRVLSSLAGLLICMRKLPTKLNPVIQPLTASLKREKDCSLQRESARCLALLISHCTSRVPCPNEKLLKNLATMACADPAVTPRIASSKEEPEGLLGDQTGDPQPETAEATVRRGAELALTALGDHFGSQLFDKLPKLWDISVGGAVSLLGGENSQGTRDQDLVNCIQVAAVLSGYIPASMVPPLLQSTAHERWEVRRVAARCLALIAASAGSAMADILRHCISSLADSKSEASRRGAAVLIEELIRSQGGSSSKDLYYRGSGGMNLVPHVGVLVVALLGRMGDPSERVRKSVMASFATLVPLLPLAQKWREEESGRSEGEGHSLAAQAQENAGFLEQLLDNRKVDDYQVQVPIKATLRRYQQEGVNWLGFLVRFKLHGILCDDMGLGKTLQTCAIMASEMFLRARDRPSEVVPSLVVCPSTLVPHWEYEINKFVPEEILRPVQYLGTHKDRLAVRSLLVPGSRAGSEKAPNVLITSYEALRSDCSWLSSLRWHFCILDEGHAIKSGKSQVSMAAKRIHAEHRFMLSGTPLQNNVLELWSLFDFLMPDFLGTEKQFQAKYGKPLVAARDPKCTAKQAEAGALALEALHKQVMPFMLRRTKEQVLKDLPPKVIQDRYCRVSELQQAIFEDFSRSQTRAELSELTTAAEKAEAAAAELEGTKEASKHVFQALQFLRKLCSHPKLVLSQMPKPQRERFLCLDGRQVDLQDISHAPKLVALRDILNECGIGVEDVQEGSDKLLSGDSSDAGHRVLVFAQHKSFLDIIERDLFSAVMPNVSYLRLDGSVEPKQRFQVVKNFNEDPTIDVLLLTTHVGGLGLNLTSADTVIFVEHDWNPMRDLQAMDRAHRLGQKRSVNVHRLIMADTMEEKIMGLQKFKLTVANTVVNADNASLQSMDTTQLLDLFNAPKQDKKVVAAETGAGEVDLETGTVSKKKGGLKAMLSSLEELWDESQYTEEYDVNAFVSRLHQK